jgi:hypothetical protein
MRKCQLRADIGEEKEPWMPLNNQQQKETQAMPGRKDEKWNIPRGKRRRRVETAAVCILSALLLFAGFPLAAGANSPKEVVLSYDQTKRMLQVRITHPSKDPAAHYISKVEIKKNDQTITVTEYRSQPPQDTFTYGYPADIGPGDVVEVKVTCNIFGSKTEKLTVP